LACRGTTGCHGVQSAGRFLAPAGGYCGFEQPTPAEALPEAATRHLAGGAPWVKIVVDWPGGDFRSDMLEFGSERPNYPLDTLVATVAAVHQAGGRLAAHTFSGEGASQSVAAGIDSIEHGWGLEDDLLVEMAAKGLAWTPTLALMPLMMKDAQARGKPHVSSWVSDRFERVRQLLPRAQRLGVPILAGTDVLPPGSIAQEIVALAHAGLEPRDALAAGSSTARRFLHEPLLDEGGAADLVLYSTDPRESVKELGRPRLIMLDGRPVLPD
jgi:imidazolonepropionase-like amidohydrolase